ncbi:MAG: MarR family transcriptional regulator [Acidiferrobacterales bacterium]
MSDSEQFGILLGETARVWRSRLDQRLKPLGLSQAKWLVLLHLSHGGDKMIQKELAERIGIEGPTLVGLLDRMARDGWLERHESNEDRRSKTVHLTDKASDVLRHIRSVATQLRRELLSGMSPDDLRLCMQVLERVKKRAETI